MFRKPWKGSVRERWLFLRRFLQPYLLPVPTLPVPPSLSATTTFFPLRAVASISHSVHARIHDCPPRTMYSLTPRTHARPHESSRNHTLLAKQSLITLAFSALPYDSEASYATFTLYGTFYSAASPRPTNIRQDYTWDGTA